MATVGYPVPVLLALCHSPSMMNVQDRLQVMWLNVKQVHTSPGGRKEIVQTRIQKRFFFHCVQTVLYKRPQSSKSLLTCSQTRQVPRLKWDVEVAIDGKCPVRFCRFCPPLIRNESCCERAVWFFQVVPPFCRNWLKLSNNLSLERVLSFGLTSLTSLTLKTGIKTLLGKAKTCYKLSWHHLQSSA
jgi:hypothetical protein